jgi:hypothetical protein
VQELDDCVDALVDLLNSDRHLSAAPIDDIADPYLDGSAAQTPLKRSELAVAFHDRTEPSERRDLIFAQILKRIVP